MDPKVFLLFLSKFLSACIYIYVYTLKIKWNCFLLFFFYLPGKIDLRDIVILSFKITEENDAKDLKFRSMKRSWKRVL